MKKFSKINEMKKYHYDLEEILYRGREFQFVCPDTFNEENCLQTFMIVDIGLLGIIYMSGYQKGWLKWRDIPREPNHHGIKVKTLLEFLNNYYGIGTANPMGFDESTFRLLPKEIKYLDE